jgi:hypothetical protein
VCEIHAKERECHVEVRREALGNGDTEDDGGEVYWWVNWQKMANLA